MEEKTENAGRGLALFLDAASTSEIIAVSLCWIYKLIALCLLSQPHDRRTDAMNTLQHLGEAATHCGCQQPHRHLGHDGEHRARVVSLNEALPFCTQPCVSMCAFIFLDTLVLVIYPFVLQIIARCTFNWMQIYSSLPVLNSLQLNSCCVLGVINLHRSCDGLAQQDGAWNGLGMAPPLTVAPQIVLCTQGAGRCHAATQQGYLQTQNLVLLAVLVIFL